MLSEFLLEIPIGQTAPNPELFTKNRLKNLNRIIILPSSCLFPLRMSPWFQQQKGLGVPEGVMRTFLGGQRGVGPLCPTVCLLAPKADIQDIHAWFNVLYPCPRYTVLFSHGNAVDLGQMSSFYIGLGTRINCNIFSYDYSGYGVSTGKPSERNLYSDIDAAWQALRTR